MNRSRMGQKATYWLFADVKQQLRAGIISKPVWFNAALLSPMFRFEGTGPKPPMIRYPEDRLRAAFIKTFPDQAEDPYRMVPGMSSRHPIDVWVTKQVALMQEGHAEEVAFEMLMTEAERQRQYEMLERRVHTSQAAEFGVPLANIEEKLAALNLPNIKLAEDDFEWKVSSRKQKLHDLAEMRKVELDEEGINRPITIEDIGPDMSATELRQFLIEFPHLKPLFDPAVELDDPKLHHHVKKLMPYITMDGVSKLQDEAEKADAEEREMMEELDMFDDDEDEGYTDADTARQTILSEAQVETDHADSMNANWKAEEVDQPISEEVREARIQRLRYLGVLPDESDPQGLLEKYSSASRAE
eukprot:TRINITY_DN693_c0_g1_i1.p1 TRINITY_DN693_c0_g1~~TRINITY_DN693_c0_g1_i1.p1  ORF type:complete len:358 (+),score=99.89 TRINITY_DN693_c0_g1_i1:185-1258(+)